MKKIPYTTCIWQDEVGKPRKVMYSFLVDSVETPDFFAENYGIILEEEKGDIVEISGITINLQRVEDLMGQLVTYQVSPTHCRDVVEDWL